jgi:hypothetical protein
VSVDREGAPGYPAPAPWAEWIDRYVRCVVVGRHGRCQLVLGHGQPHAVVLETLAGKRAWRWDGDGAGWLDDGGPWGNIATDRAPWIPGWP